MNLRPDQSVNDLNYSHGTTPPTAAMQVYNSPGLAVDASVHALPPDAKTQTWS